MTAPAVGETVTVAKASAVGKTTDAPAAFVGRRQYAGSEWLNGRRRWVPGTRGGDKGAYKAIARVRWELEDYVEVTVRGSLCTHDSDELARLVLLCMANRVRLELEAVSNWGYTRLVFYAPKDPAQWFRRGGPVSIAGQCAELGLLLYELPTDIRAIVPPPVAAEPRA